MFTFIDYVAYTLREDKLLQYIIDTMKFLNFPIDIKVIASRFNIGPDHDYKIALTNEYGDRIINVIDMLKQLLELE